MNSAGVLFRKLPRLLPDANVQITDRQWSSILVDEEVKKGGWESKSIEEFWKESFLRKVASYEQLATFNINKSKLRNKLSMKTLESIIKTCERFPSNFALTPSLCKLYSSARYFSRYSDIKMKMLCSLKHKNLYNHQPAKHVSKNVFCMCSLYFTI